MMKLRISAFATLVWLAGAFSAFAQTSPNFTFGQVPTVAQWNALFANKQDFLGAPPCIVTGCTYTGRIVTLASSISNAGFNIATGTAPTSPVDGDVWVTTAGMFVRINGATVGPLASSAGGPFTGQVLDTGATTTSPGWYVQITGDTTPRVRIGMNATDIPSIALGPGNAVRDLFLERVGAANLRHGAPDAAAPVAQTLSVQNVVAGTSNTAGAGFTIAGSQGTGTGVGGSLLFKTAPAGSTGSTQNALATALTIFGTGGISTGAATDQGAGTLNLVGSLFNNGTAPTGTGGYVRAAGATLTGTTTVATLAATTINAFTLGGTIAGGANAINNVTLQSSTVVLGGVTMTLGSDANGDIYYRSGGVLTRLPIGANTNVLTVSGSLPTWQAASSAASITDGTTTINSGVSGSILGNASGVLTHFTRAQPNVCDINTTAAATCANGGSAANNGTYTTPSGALYLKITLTGGGGGGSSAGSGVSGVIGTAGNPSCWNTTGAACTTPVYQAGGGGAGTGGGTPTGGAGGTISGSGTCAWSAPGGGGQGGSPSVGGSFGGPGGAGGNSFLSGGAPGSLNSASAGANAAANTGGGGAGGVLTINGGSTGAGGGGGGTCVAFISTPAATYTYASAATAAGGTAGTNGTAGGIGAGGKILVEAFFEHHQEKPANDNEQLFIDQAA